ncbi:uncharacterized protein J3R85_002888 [Psidium guajava]|nr:uncharacterized protein J3R85_002888 [Psidium guajava]
MPSYLACGPCLRIDSAHLLHCQGKLSIEVIQLPLKDLCDEELGRSIDGENRIKSKEASPLEHKAVLAEVKGSAAARVHLHSGVVIWAPALLGLEIHRVLVVSGRVLILDASEVV